MLTEHLSGFRVVFFVNTKLHLFGIDGFVDFSDSGFSSVSYILAYDVHVTSIFISLVVKGFSFHGAKQFIMGYGVFHDGNGVFLLLFSQPGLLLGKQVSN